MTICVQHQLHLFGAVVNGEIQLNAAGQMAQTVWEALPERFPGVKLDAHIVMPNHFHGIVVIGEGDTVGATLVVAHAGVNDEARAGTRPAPTTKMFTLGDMIGAFKSITTRRYIQGIDKLNWMPFDKRLWQRNYWEKIVRNERHLNAIRRYIYANPINWAKDRYYSSA